MSTCDFAIFAPRDTLEFYTEISDDSDKALPKYLTPLTINKTPRVFRVSSLNNKFSKYPAIALFKNPEVYKTLFEPQIDSYLVKDIGIIPVKNVICEGEIYWSFNENKENSKENNKL